MKGDTVEIKSNKKVTPRAIVKRLRRQRHQLIDILNTRKFRQDIFRTVKRDGSSGARK